MSDALRPRTRTPRRWTLPGRRTPLLTAALVLALLAMACGDTATDPGGAGDPTTPGASPSASPGASPSATADPGPDAGLTPVRLAFVPATTGLLVNVAKEQGLFAANGLDVELSPATNISEIIPALGRQFEISLGTATDLINAAASGLDVVQILGNTNDTADNPFVQLVVKADSGITGITDLAGKRVGSPTLSGVIHVATLHWAKQEGVDPASIQGVQVPPPNTVDQLTSGQVDAVEALEPFASNLIASGNVSLGDPFASIGLPLATNFWMADGAWARDNPDVVAAFATSLEQALAFVESNEPEARTILQGYTGLPPQVATNVPLPTFNLEIRTADLGTWIEVLRGLDQFDGDVEPADLVLSASPS